MGGRTFWKADFTAQTATRNTMLSQFVTKSKGYLLLVVVVSRDLAGRQAIEESLASIRFADASN